MNQNVSQQKPVDVDPMVEVTPEGLAPWSVSKLKTLEKCPLKFFLQYVIKLKVEVSEDDDRMLAHIGSALHDILEQVVQGTDVKKALARTRIKYRKSIDKETWNEKVVGRIPNVEEFMGRLNAFTNANPVKNIYTEQKLAVTKDWKPAQFFDNQNAYFRGVIDLVLHLENGDAFIIDHKTGGTTKFGMRNYEFQLDSYKPLFHFGKEPINAAQAGIHFISEGSMMQGVLSDTHYIEDTVVSNLNFAIECAVDKVIDKGYFYYERNNFCKYCDFKEMCKAGPRGTSGELQKYEELSKQMVNNWKKLETQEDEA